VIPGLSAVSESMQAHRVIISYAQWSDVPLGESPTCASDRVILARRHRCHLSKCGSHISSTTGENHPPSSGSWSIEGFVRPDIAVKGGRSGGFRDPSIAMQTRLPAIEKRVLRLLRRCQFGATVSTTERAGEGAHEDGAPHLVGRRLRRLTSYQASPRLVVTGSSTLVGNPDDVPPAAYSGEWVPGSTRGAPMGVGEVSLPLHPWPSGGPSDSDTPQRSTRQQAKRFPCHPDRFRCTRKSRAVC